jgi:predicted small secreted protein
MSDKKEGFFAQIKNQIIAGVGIILTTLGGVFIDEVKSFVGIESDEQTEQVKVEQKQEVNVEGPTIVVNIPEQQPVKEKVIIKEVKVPVKKKKEVEEEADW